MDPEKLLNLIKIVGHKNACNISPSEANMIGLLGV
jgi:hypothetical protein